MATPKTLPKTKAEAEDHLQRRKRDLDAPLNDANKALREIAQGLLDRLVRYVPYHLSALLFVFRY